MSDYDDDSDTGFPPEAPTEPQSDASEGVEVTTLQIDSTIIWEGELVFEQAGYADAFANLVAETVREMGSPRRLSASEQSDDDSYDEDDDEVKEDEDPLDAISRNDETIRRLEELVEQGEMMMAELQTAVVDLLVAARRPRLTARRRLGSRRAP
ncbi:hypothetical protein HPB49_022482 [Dermacentor silvarum]|uniref:Uncharacterized protein n=1 Tax=Dermacentor silvarum TaxID=543639 RepID=A0ACB8D8I8_DERSI|nr:uncharacterized protein LOC125943881 [Dermacentor silvarum]KAH7960708.1 hypothetical protein HPB49_022482 [Dermacentor silvarum]